MNEVRQSEPETWEQLKQDFVVTKSTQEFCNLFIDQGLEQEIKKNLKRYGALPGLTQDEDLMERFITTSPHLVQLIERFLSDFPKHTSPEDEPDAYHQLQGNLGLRCAINSVRIRNCVVTFCRGNPYVVNTLLRNITSSQLIPAPASADILRYPEKGKERYEAFIKERLLPTADLSIWDPLPQLKLIRFATSNKKKAIKVDNKVVLNLREDRQLYKKIILIAEKRPGIISGMEELVSHYEMSIVPRSTFNPDGSLLLCLDKASLMKSVLSQPSVQKELSVPGDREGVLIIDAMVDVQCLKKRHDTKKLIHLKKQFIERVKQKANRGN